MNWAELTQISKGSDRSGINTRHMYTCVYIKLSNSRVQYGLFEYAYGCVGVHTGIYVCISYDMGMFVMCKWGHKSLINL